MKVINPNFLDLPAIPFSHTSTVWICVQQSDVQTHNHRARARLCTDLKWALSSGTEYLPGDGLNLPAIHEESVTFIFVIAMVTKRSFLVEKKKKGPFEARENPRHQMRLRSHQRAEARVWQSACWSTCTEEDKFISSVPSLSVEVELKESESQEWRGSMCERAGCCWVERRGLNPRD